MDAFAQWLTGAVIACLTVTAVALAAERPVYRITAAYACIGAYTFTTLMIVGELAR